MGSGFAAATKRKNPTHDIARAGQGRRSRGEEETNLRQPNPLQQVLLRTESGQSGALPGSRIYATASENGSVSTTVPASSVTSNVHCRQSGMAFRRAPLIRSRGGVQDMLPQGASVRQFIALLILGKTILQEMDI